VQDIKEKHVYSEPSFLLNYQALEPQKQFFQMAQMQQKILF